MEKRGDYFSEADVDYKIRSIFEEFKKKSNKISEIKSQYPAGSGKADIVLFGKDSKPFIVIEDKKISDPYEIKVVEQASRYANSIGSEYFATANNELLVLFKTFEPGTALMERKLKQFSLTAKLAEEVINDIEEGVRWLPQTERFIVRLLAFHKIFSQHLLKSFKKELNSSKRFNEEYETWVKNQGWPLDEITQVHTVRQAAYLIMNKVLFYKVLETNLGLPKLKISETLNINKTLHKYFLNALKIDYKSIFTKGFFDEIVIPPESLSLLQSFANEMTHYDFSKFKQDTLGAIYERLIPPDERKGLGQFYTSPGIVDLINSFVIKDSNDKVLDPACGSGTFLVRAYHRLAELKGVKDISQEEHSKLLKQIYGVDINQFASHLSTINIALQYIKSKKNDSINVITSDTFDVKPGEFIPIPYGNGLKDIYELKFKREGFDAIVGNPPYIRQERINRKSFYQSLVSSKKFKVPLNSDIYFYFFVYCINNFLKEGGRFGFITSDSWLSVKYGEVLQKYLLDNCKIITIISLDKSVFPDALVNTCITILEKNKDASQRTSNIVKFVKVKKGVNLDKIIKKINETNVDFEDTSIKIVAKLQEKLRLENKWALFLNAPSIYFKIINSDKITKLKNIADVKFGRKTGANDFFVVDKELVKQWGIEKEYLMPVIDDPKEIKKIQTNSKESNRFLLNIFSDKQNLYGKNVLRYIEYGEGKTIRIKGGVKGGEKIVGYQNLQSVKSHRPFWYSLLKRKAAPIIFPFRVWDKHFVMWNTDSFFATDVFHELYPKKEEYLIPILASLNSDVTRLSLELLGRSYGGGVTEIRAYELGEMPVINVDKLSKEENQKLEICFMELVNAQNSKNSEKEKIAREKLNLTICSIMGLDKNDYTQLVEGLSQLKKARQLRPKKEVLVDYAPN